MQVPSLSFNSNLSYLELFQLFTLVHFVSLKVLGRVSFLPMELFTLISIIAFAIITEATIAEAIIPFVLHGLG